MKHLLLVAISLVTLNSYGQLQTFVGDVSILMTPSFLGTDYVVSNAQFTGNPQAVGSFISDTTNLGFENGQRVAGVCLTLGDLLAGQLATGDRVKALDALGHVAVGDALHFEFVEVAEFGDLLEGKGGVLNQPDCGRLGHQWCA